jgi:hypothetical protein
MKNKRTVIETLIVPFGESKDKNKPASLRLQGYKEKEINTIDKIIVYERRVPADKYEEPERVIVHLDDGKAEYEVKELESAGYRIVEIDTERYILFETKRKHIKVGL